MKRIRRRIFAAGLGPQEEFKREAIKLVNEQGLRGCKKTPSHDRSHWKH